MKSTHRKLVSIVLAFVVYAAMPHETAAEGKPRAIVTTDGEVDDRCSMNRFLLYANEWDIQGLIYSSSKYHWKGDAKHERNTWHGETWMSEMIDEYAAVYPNLKQHDPDYPSPEHLKSRVYVGNIAYVGDMAEATPGSDRIVEVLLDPDPSPVWLQAWGGSNTIARALKTIEEEHPQRMAEVSKKAKLFLIASQDDTWKAYILKRWPDALLIKSGDFTAIAYGWRKIMSREQQEYFDANWMTENILDGHGPLCAGYEARPDKSFRSEGDSPAFMHMLHGALGSLEHPTYGGWGGRFTWSGSHWKSARDDGKRYTSILRWVPAFQNDWAARADWCVKPYGQSNHNPEAVCNGDNTQRVMEIAVDPGADVRLSAAGSSDPDGDTLAYRWWVYKEPGTYWDLATIQGENAPEAVVSVPENASGRTIHIILEITDAGAPPLTAYRRIILTVGGEPVEAPATTEASFRWWTPGTRVTKLSGPSAESGEWSFYRGINLNGPAIEIDGNRWEGDGAANFICNNRPLNSPGVELIPPTDDVRAKMIHAFRWDGNVRIALTEVPDGKYAVYTYVWEDNNPESFRVSLEGGAVVADYDSGDEGQWQRLGPWIVMVSDGTIEIVSAGGAANVSGVEVWRSVE